MKKILGIINASPYYQNQNGDCFMQPSELKSLEMFGFFDKIFLYKPRKYTSTIPNGWIKVKKDFICKELCKIEDSRFKRKQNTKINISKYIHDIDIDIFYFRMPNYEASWAWEIIRKENIPFFTELHGDWEESIINEDSNSFIRKLTRKYRAEKATQIVEKMVNESLFVMTIGHKLTKYIKDKDKPILVTTNHLLNKKYYVKLDKKRKQNEVFKILFVGDVQVRKGLLYLFKAFKLLIDKGMNVQLDIVGSGASESILKAYVLKQNMKNKVIFHGRIPHGNLLFQFFKDADIFVLPSVGAEGVPRVTHEAMAMSCPVIATDVGSVSWQLENNCGIVIPPKDEISLFNSIKLLIESPEVYDKLVENGYQRSLKFTYEKQKESIEKFILGQINE